jgi:uncharacterized protein
MKKKRSLFFILFRVLCGVLFGLNLLMSPLEGKESIPSPPLHYFNDDDHVVSPTVARNLNQRLALFDQRTSNQVVVVIYSKFESKTSLDDYAQKLYTAWHLGTKKNSNGALLLIFPAEHKIRIQTGYGLEGALPDVICKRIIDDIMVPQFQKGDYDQGVIDGVNALMKATAHEYEGIGQHKKRNPSWLSILLSPLGFFFLLFFGSIILNWRQRRMGIDSGGWWMGGGGMGGGFGGGGDSGGFSGGGGDSGGGGASGGW